MKKILMVFGLVWSAMTAMALEVTSVTAQQRYPWNGKVDIAVTFNGTEEEMLKYDCIFVATNNVTKAELPVLHIEQIGSDSGSGTIWTRRFLWDATADIGKEDVGKVRIEDVAFTVDVCQGVQLWENGPYWAKCNIGATKPEEYGYYFWWGDTVGYKRVGDRWDAADGSRTGFSFSGSPTYGKLKKLGFSFSSCPTYGKSNSELKKLGYIDSTGNLVAKHDAATVHWGAPWRMPTDAEFSALISNCTTTWTTRNGINGMLVTGKGAYASRSIFLPAAGFGLDSHLNSLGSYDLSWSSTPLSGESLYAWNIYFHWRGFDRSNRYRYYGQSVRPVRGFAK